MRQYLTLVRMAVSALGQHFGLFFVAFEQMKHQPERGFLPDSRQFRHLIHRIFYKFGGVFQWNYEL